MGHQRATINVPLPLRHRPGLELHQLRLHLHLHLTSSGRSSLTQISSNDVVSSSHPRPRPHRQSEPQWSSIRAATALSPLLLRHLKLLRQLGSGNLARVYLCRLRDSPTSLFALKVVDRDGLTPSKLAHVQTESQVLSMLDHPFLPTLYAHLEVSHYTCLLIDYCPRGDLHSLLRAQPNRRLDYTRHTSSSYSSSSCFGFFNGDGDGRDEEEETVTEFVAEPSGAYSRSCVGTHEYLAPELVSGNGHGNGVDWWAFGVLVYELMYGTTPFKGESKECTLRNIAGARGVRFPVIMSREDGEEGAAADAKDLIGRLLAREEGRRLGCARGAAEVKRHPFFKRVKWPLIRMQRVPEEVVRSGGNKLAHVGSFRRGFGNFVKWSGDLCRTSSGSNEIKGRKGV
ncbi:hypothetical protein Scep_000867 [Stephania cephalantha]|uniref:non-specific serine/threonine protein kinase n=1 Tax=Stephania cephalantha TaxID=152367 RepID=A0AAP0L7E8_9MAGN